MTNSKSYPLWWSDHPKLHDPFPDIYAVLERLEGEDDGRFLYRSQSGVFGDPLRQVPSLYRGALSEPIDRRVKRSHEQICKVFDHLLSLDTDHAKWFVTRLGQIDKPSPNAQLILAIGQHYGIKTELLDLTSNLRIAAMFSTQSWVSIEEARNLRANPNLKRPLPNDPYGFIYRYDRRALETPDSTLIDLSRGSAGGRPLLQRGWALSIGPDEDFHFLSRGAYEVFPFQRDPALPAVTMRQDDFYCRGNGEYIEELRGFTLWGGNAHGESLLDMNFSLIDLILPEMTLFPINDDEYILGEWEIGTDLFLTLGEIAESGLASTRRTNILQPADMFGSLYGKTLKDWRNNSTLSNS